MRCLSPTCQLSGVGCDNMTALLICFLPPSGGYEALAIKTARPASCGPAAAILSPPD